MGFNAMQPGKVKKTDLIIAGVALLATEGIVDLVVADETVSHARQVDLRVDRVGVGEPAVVGDAGIVGVELRPNVRDVAQVLARRSAATPVVACREAVPPEPPISPPPPPPRWRAAPDVSVGEGNVFHPSNPNDAATAAVRSARTGSGTACRGGYRGVVVMPGVCADA